MVPDQREPACRECPESRKFTSFPAARLLPIVLLLPFIGYLAFAPLIAQEAPVLDIVVSQESVLLSWTAPAGQNRWAVLRSSNPYMVPADTLALTSQTHWVDTDGAAFQGKHRFYRVLPWIPGATPPGLVLEPFEVALPELTSYGNFDYDPDVSLVPREEGSEEQCIRLSGDTWKVMSIDPRPVNRSTVWSIDGYCESRANYQMIGFGDGTDDMWYVLWGREAPNTDSLITTYQGYFPLESWQTFHLPIGEDWHGRFGTEPEIDRVYLVNDRYTTVVPGIWYLDNLLDATGSMPTPPEAAFNWRMRILEEVDSLEVRFTNLTHDPDSDELEFFWSFGDGTHSTAEHPLHFYPRGGSWPVTLRVTDGSLYWHYHSAVVSDYPVTRTPQPFTIACVGDIILARSVASDYIVPQGAGSVYDGVRDLLTAPAITIANLESPLTYYNERHPTKSIVFKGLPPYADGLPGSGIDMVTLANNHILDYLESGMLETMATMDALNIPWVGAGMNDILARRPTFLNSEGMVIAVAGYSNRDGHYNNAQPFLDAGRDRAGFAYWNRAAIEATVPQMVEQSDLTMLQVHCGSEYSRVPMDGDKRNLNYVGELEPDDPYVIFSMIPDSGEVALRHYAVEQGADLVICHHPHIIQGLEVYQGKLIAHSLGNFIFDLTYNETLPSMVVNIDVSPSEGVIGADVVPIWIENHLPVVAQGGLGNSVLDYLSHYSRLLNTHFVRFPGESVGRVMFDTTYARGMETGLTTLPLYEAEGVRMTRPFRVEGDGHLSRVALPDVPPGMMVRYGRDIFHYGNMEDEGTDPWFFNTDRNSYQDALGRNGSRGIQLFGPSTGEPFDGQVDLRRRVQVNNSYPHSFLGWVSTQGDPAAKVRVVIFSARSGGNATSWETPTINGTQPFTPIHVDMESVPANRSFADVRAVASFSGSLTSAAWFDDFALIEWGNWQVVSPTGYIDVPYPNGYRYLQVRIPPWVTYPADTVTVQDQREWPISMAP